MHLTFIKPNMGLVHGEPYVDTGRMEPLTFAVLKGLTPPEHEVTLIDDRFEVIRYDAPTDLVAINTEIYTARRAYEIAAEYRARGVPVVLGGYHVTMIPEEGARFGDSLVVGHAEGVWPELLADAARGALRPRYQGGPGGAALLDGVRTDWSIFAGKRYLPVRLSQFSRGCSNHCEYCATGSIYRRSFRCRPVAEVVGELAAVGAKTVFFVDDNIVGDQVKAAELFRALRPLGLRWFGQADITCTDNPALLELMLESGCVGLVIGFESLDPENLGQMNKRHNLAVGGYDRAVERLRGAGMLTWAAFLLGYDRDTPESVRRTCDWALSKKFAFAAFNILMPYPGTPFFERMRAAGRLRYGGRWWLHDDYRFGETGIVPARCSADELAEACREARARHSSLWQIARRACDRQTHLKDGWSLLTYLAYNPLFRRELFKKDAMMLGYRGRERAGAPPLQSSPPAVAAEA